MKQQLRNCREDLLSTREKIANKQIIKQQDKAALLLLLHETADLMEMIARVTIV